MFELSKKTLIAVAIGSLTLTGCLSSGSSSSNNSPGSSNEEVMIRDQQKRIDDGFFQVDESNLPFDVLVDVAPYNTSSRWSGVLNGAGYRVEVPEDWNGMLVMYAHGFRGEGSELTVDSPPQRKYLLDNGYAWAASSYSANYYDVRSGVEDTNALALAFKQIAADNDRVLDTPDKIYITGVSMGGHISAAAVERETIETANNVVEYAGAAPLCAVLGDTELFNYFAGFNLGMFALAQVPVDSFPISEDDAADKLTVARELMWSDYAANKNADGLTPNGLPLYQMLKNLSGGERPIYSYSFGAFQELLQGFAGSDGTVDGVFNTLGIDTTQLTYRFQTERGETLSTDENNFNSMIFKVEADPGFNALRDDGLRWVPKVNGEFDVPVVTAHTTGDLFVPISMEQIYRERAEEKGSSGMLVQRAIRAPGHCDFTLNEFEETLDAMLQWEQGGVKPNGDDFLDPATVAAADFGCAFTDNANEIPGNFPRDALPSCFPQPL